MFRSLLVEARFWPVIWRRRFAYYRLVVDTDNLKFFSMFGMLILCVIGVVRFAYVDRTLIEPARIHAEQREAALALRRATDLECLAENIYFEARGEPLDGQYAVAEVTLNRTRADHFPHTVCGVVHETRWDPSRGRFVADFSWTELGALSPQGGADWKQAMAVASAAYDDQHELLVPGALFYHATSVHPAWSKTRKAVATIGKHIFYL
ncbi:MAG TPA: cell wall hydrolase [Steroidobacteraceae bacterium]|jgi:spore germination cell wall hydrolase CwlJ-like protein|nr:cell wall hydrolase [Steroidobacteraceae bacterium]